MRHMSAKRNKPNSTDSENNLGAGAVDVWGYEHSPLLLIDLMLTDIDAGSPVEEEIKGKPQASG